MKAVLSTNKLHTCSWSNDIVKHEESSFRNVFKIKKVARIFKLHSLIHNPQL